MPPSVIGYLCFLKSTLFQLYNKPSCQGDIRSRGGPLYAYYVTSMYFLLHECVSPVSVLNWVHWGDGKYPITFSMIECVFSYMRSQENHRSTHPQHVLISDSVSVRVWFVVLCPQLVESCNDILKQISFCSVHRPRSLHKTCSSKTQGKVANTTRYHKNCLHFNRFLLSRDFTGTVYSICVKFMGVGEYLLSLWDTTLTRVWSLKPIQVNIIQSKIKSTHFKCRLIIQLGQIQLKFYLKPFK